MASNKSGDLPLSLRKTIAKNITRYREKMYPGHGGQGKAARDFGCGQQTWGPWENGTRVPGSIDKYIELAEFFGVTVDELVGKSSPLEGETRGLDNELTIQNDALQHLATLFSLLAGIQQKILRNPHGAERLLALLRESEQSLQKSREIS